MAGETQPNDTHSAHPAMRRAAALFGDRPEAAAAVAAFAELLAQALEFPQKAAAAAFVPVPPAAPALTVHLATPAEAIAPAANPCDSWLPVLGRSAAGVPQFWEHGGEPDGWADTLARHSRQAAVRTLPATAQEGPSGGSSPAWLICSSEPTADGISEFVAAADIKARHPDAFAVRIDGDSMSPEIRHGDLVILSPSAPATDAWPAVVQLRGQIGVTCKIFRRNEGRVHLVPLNEQLPPQTFDADAVVWALRVLARVRPG